MYHTDKRLKKLRKQLITKPYLRILEAHNGLSGLIVEHTSIVKNGRKIEFDGMWSSSLTDSLSRGKPDISIIDITTRLITIEEILDVTSKPILLDFDNGGSTESFMYSVPKLERLGISAAVIEDKVGVKRNSLLGVSENQDQDSIESFSEKISKGKRSQTTKDFMIIARIESLTLNKGMEDALRRAKAYLEAGADGILIHSKNESSVEVLEFAHTYKKFSKQKPLAVVPTTYNSVTEQELSKAGVNIIIYANHLLRSAYDPMLRTAQVILENERAFEAERHCMSINKVLKLIPVSQ